MADTNGQSGDDAAAAISGPATFAMPGPVLLYDGLCGLCNGTVRFVLARDAGGVMGFAPLDGEFAGRVHETHPWVREVDSLVLVEPAATVGGPPRVRVRSDAALALTSYIGGAWRLAAVLRVVPRFLRDAAYDFVARHRYRWFGRYESCPIPLPEVRTRFLQ